MNKDLIYIFDKVTFKREKLGEIQSNFNMSMTIDGTKDSCSVLVWSYSSVEIEPYTICWHEKTNTWWVVSHDKIDRYQNETGFIYVHNLELLGAIELLNARDLTDCGFNDNTYTISQFIERLFSLSNIEYPLLFDSGINQDFLAKKVDFIKTFENYTLLSALREFLDAYNMCPKLTFDTTIVSNETLLYYARLHIVSKTGDNTLTEHNVDDFDDVKETKTMDKNSFGTCVVSNAENVITSQVKIFPSSGSVKLSSKENTIVNSNALIRLPSKVYKGLWIKMMYPIVLNIISSSLTAYDWVFYPGNDNSINKLINNMYQWAVDHHSAAFAQALLEDLTNNKETLNENLNKIASVRFFEGNKIVPYFSGNSSTVKIEKGDDVPYLTKMGYAAGKSRAPMIFTDKETKQMLPQTFQGVSWERGSDIIDGFQFIQYLGYDDPLDFHNFWIKDTEWQSTNRYPYQFQLGDERMMIEADMDINVNKYKISFVVCYIPMSDIKIKVDNQRTKKDIQLYNQNGKLTDNFALSKLINSYSKEISSDNIVRYMQYRKYNDIPKVGSFVNYNNDVYVINNVSMTFTQNENTNDNFGYLIDCEFNMSKAVSTKSMMVNPNTNIRDYGIPQRFNVRRKQLYRDYYEINYATNEDTETEYYLDASNIFVFGHNVNTLNDFIAVMKLTYDEQIGGDTDMGTDPSDEWYYQLETTNYYMNKMFYIMLDFKDNNIIGYGSQNVFCGFDVSRIFTGMTDTINIPISYVDDLGKVKGINIKLATNEDLTSVYGEYQDDHSGQSYENSLYNYSVFIPEDIYEDVESTITINEENYNKDALEVPVFEYACQIDDSYDVLIGDNILTPRNGNIKYFYSFVKGHNITQDNAVQTNRVREKMTSPLGWILSDGATIEYERFSNTIRLLRIRIYNSQFYDLNDLSWNDQNQLDFEEGYDYAFFRHAYDFTTKEEIVDLLFIAKAVPSTHISNDGKILTLEINHYKLN